MAWFTRKDKGIVTPTALKREAPDGCFSTYRAISVILGRNVLRYSTDGAKQNDV